MTVRWLISITILCATVITVVRPSSWEEAAVCLKSSRESWGGALATVEREPATMFQAETNCKHKGGYLGEIYDWQEKYILTAFVEFAVMRWAPEEKEDGMWLGFNQKEQKWSSGKAMFWANTYAWCYDWCMVLSTNTWKFECTVCGTGSGNNYKRLKEIMNNLPDDDDESTLKFLAHWGLIANRMHCPGTCARDFMSLVKRNDKKAGYLWRCNTCRVNGHTATKSVFADSFFDNSHLSVKQIFSIIMKATQPLPNSITNVHEETGISMRTLVDWYNFIRDIYGHWAEQNLAQRRIGGLDGNNQPFIVECDESAFFKRKYNRGRMIRQTRWVLGCIERGTGRIMISALNDQRRDIPTILLYFQQWILPNTIIVTDGWAAYPGVVAALNNMNRNVQHWFVNHRVNFVDPNDDRIHTQGIEGAWAKIKERLPFRRSGNNDMFTSYLEEYMFRRNYQNRQILGHTLFWIRHRYPFD